MMPLAEALRVEMVGRETARPGKYLTFTVGESLYGLPIECVVHVLGRVSATPLPGAPSYVRGVVEFRGHVLPVLDARCELGASEIRPPGAAIIVYAVLEGTATGLALIVDAVHTVVEFGPGDIEDAPPLSRGRHLALGVARTAGKGMAVLLDLERLLAECEKRGKPAPAPAEGKLPCAAPTAASEGEVGESS